MLRAYDTLIIDEAHERSLNIDFLLGYLKQLLPQPARPQGHHHLGDHRPGALLAGHFGGRARSSRCPAGRTRSRSATGRWSTTATTDDERRRARPDRGDLRRGRRAARRGPRRHPGVPRPASGRSATPPTRCADAATCRDTEILPLYARLSAAEQHRVFQPHTGPPGRAGHQRRRDLADRARASGTSSTPAPPASPATATGSRCSGCRSSRSPRRRPTSARAAAAGPRDGICIRLYAEDDFVARPEFTDPEILRTNLASVILQMTALGLGDVAAFPFVEPPDRRNVNDGVDAAAGAGRARRRPQRQRLTAARPQAGAAAGRPAAGPDGARGRRATAALREVLVIAAALSIQDPRERPAGQAAGGRREARPVRRPGLGLPRLPQPVELPAGAAAGAVLQPVPPAVQGRVPQLPARPRVAGPATASCARSPRRPGRRRRTAEPADAAAGSTPSLLAGLLSHIGLQRRRRSASTSAPAAPGSRSSPARRCSKKPPRWVMAAELVETSRLWARVAARIEPEWVEPLAEHLVKRSYSEPHWETQAGRGHGVREGHAVRRAARRRAQGQLRPDRPGAVAASCSSGTRWSRATGSTHHTFFHDNRRAARRGRGAGAPGPPPRHRGRRRDPVRLLRRSGSRADVVSGRHFDTWWKTGPPRASPTCSPSTRDCWSTPAAAAVDEADYPDALAARAARRCR